MAMLIRNITVAELPGFIRSEAFLKSTYIPISPKRALSHAANPRATPDDIALVTAWEGDELLGYMGILPDQIQANGGTENIGWLSCWWVRDDQRRTGLALQLLYKAIDLYGNRVLLTEFTPKARKIYEATGRFVPLAERKGVKAVLQVNFTEWLIERQHSLRQIRLIIWVIDYLLNLLASIYYFFYLKVTQSPRFERVSFIDTETEAFINEQQKPELTRRNAAELNWVLKNPWISSGPKDMDAERYHFTAVSKRFEYFGLKTRGKDGQLTGFMILSLRDKVLRTPYIYCKPGWEGALLKVVQNVMLREKAEMLITFQDELVKVIYSKKRPFLLVRNTSRLILMGKPLEKLVDKSLYLQDGDGDCAFT